MKKLRICFIALMALVLTSNIKAGDDLIGNGFDLQLSFGFPSKDYGFPDYAEPDYGTMLGIQLGNHWYFYNDGKFGVGLNVNWIDFSYVGKEKNGSDYGTIDMSFCELGPVGSFAISDQFAIDAFYNLRPTALMSYYNNSNDEDLLVGSGVTHSLGARFRFNIVYVGMDMVFGKLNGKWADAGDKEDMTANNTRITLGLKF